MVMKYPAHQCDGSRTAQVASGFRAVGTFELVTACFSLSIFHAVVAIAASQSMTEGPPGTCHRKHRDPGKGA